MINVDNLSLTIKRKVILDNINLEVKRGSIVGLIGRNGSGKTMLMKCICGFVKPTYGTITADGKLVGKEIDFPENMGLIIETPTFINYYSGYKNLKILSGYKKLIGEEKIVEVLKKVWLYDERKKPVMKYSLGMKQRLAIAQAIMEDPELLVLDEPMNGLDKHGVEEMRKLFQKLKDSGKTIILASHNKDDIEILCDHVYEMELGTMTKVR